MGPLTSAISETEGDEPPESDKVPAVTLSRLTGKEVLEYNYEKRSASEEDPSSSHVLEISACQAESSHPTLVAENMDTCAEPSSMEKRIASEEDPRSSQVLELSASQAESPHLTLVARNMDTCREPSPLVTSIVSCNSACQAEPPKATFIAGIMNTCTSVCQTELPHSRSCMAIVIPHNSACQAESSHPTFVAGSMEKCTEPSSVAIMSHTSSSDIGRETEGSQVVHLASLGVSMAAQNGTFFQTTSAVEDLDLEKGLSQLPQESEQASHDGKQQGKGSKLDRNESTGEHVCRVCYLGLAAQSENGPPIELGCECKHDLAFAHRQCAETWFKIKGNRTCEICGSTVLNINGIDDPNFLATWNDGNARATAATDEARCWQNHRLFNVLLACMVFAFVLPWLFHVTAFFT